MGRYTYPILYLQKILSLKVCFLADKNCIIEPTLLKFCKAWNEEFENYYIIHIDYSKEEVNLKYSFFITFSDKKTSLSEISGRIIWPDVLVIGKNLNLQYSDPNCFGMNSLSYDILSSNFIPFKMITNSDDEKLIACVSKDCSIPKMNSSSIQYKICYYQNCDFKYIRFFCPNNDAGICIEDRKIHLQN